MGNLSQQPSVRLEQRRVSRSMWKAAALLLCAGPWLSGSSLAGTPARTAPVPVSTKAATAAPTAEQLLQDSDLSRGGVAVGVEWTVDVDARKSGNSSKMTYAVKAKGTNAVAECIAPASCKGQVILFNDRTLWFFKAGFKRPVRLSGRQRLSGEAATGDIAFTYYARDYIPTLVGEEKVDGKDAYKLELKAKTKDVTYDQIRYWISKEEHLGIKAEFLTLKGDLFKTATFEYANSVINNGQKEPFVSRMVITNATFKDDITSLTYRDPVIKAHPDSIFQIESIVR